MLPTPSKSVWFEQGSSFISLEDMVGVQFTPRQRAFTVLRFAYGICDCVNFQNFQKIWLKFKNIFKNQAILVKIWP